MEIVFCSPYYIIINTVQNYLFYITYILSKYIFLIFIAKNFVEFRKNATFAPAFNNKTGKSCTASSLRILQDGNVAKVVGCSGAIQVAYPPASLAQLARARDL